MELSVGGTIHGWNFPKMEFSIGGIFQRWNFRWNFSKKENSKDGIFRSRKYLSRTGNSQPWPCQNGKNYNTITFPRDWRGVSVSWEPNLSPPPKKPLENHTTIVLRGWRASIATRSASLSEGNANVSSLDQSEHFFYSFFLIYSIFLLNFFTRSMLCTRLN